jgi:hypothetical protein
MDPKADRDFSIMLDDYLITMENICEGIENNGIGSYSIY